VGKDTAETGELRKARAHWVAARTIAWDIDHAKSVIYQLHYDPGGTLALGPCGIVGGQALELTEDGAGLPDEIRTRFPHLRDYVALEVSLGDLSHAREALKCQLAVSALDAGGHLVDASGVQIPGVVGDLYKYDGVLGPTFCDDVPTLKLWAPTARCVTLHLFDDADSPTASTTALMKSDPDTGVWSVTGDPQWRRKYYLYEVEVFAPSTGKVERNLVTDPYSVSLALNSRRSQILDLAGPDLIPEGWEALAKPILRAPEDIVIYELHVRDFSANDSTVPAAKRGTYLAFTEAQSNGMRHLRRLAECGLTHIHLLPVFDFATVDEDRTQWQQPDFRELAALPPDSDQQQRIVSEFVSRDGYNWGYDPLHYSVPEGSYSTDPNGPTRILEFREMVMALNESGLRVVMDVVYNHTHAGGQNEKSVLDRIVPGYYHRLDADGRVENSTCCENTATEHYMMRKLMIDSLLTWARAYKVDAFRFDLMGHHLVVDVIAAKDALHKLKPEVDGVDGSQIHLYGEGWDFGEVARNARGLNASQLNVGGMGIGTFNDRIRDAVRGGGAFGRHREQGFITGLYYDPNEAEDRPAAAQKLKLMQFADWIRLALTGNLRDYAFTDLRGRTVTGAEVDYDGCPVGYTRDPHEHVPYISAHDNETLFDAIQYKAPASASKSDRVRIQNLGISLVALCQGVPFFHAGVDMLRSKSFDRDSYQSGDWFNKLDFSYQGNNFGAGLPLASENEANWAMMRPLLVRGDLKPVQDDIVKCVVHFQEMLQIRASSPLFRLRTADQVMQRVRFHNTGPDQVPGIIVMSLTDVGLSTRLDPDFDLIVVVFNATNEAQRITIDGIKGAPLTLHPVQLASIDPVVRLAAFDEEKGAFAVLERTTAVFVAPSGVLSRRPFSRAQL
jgi:pullulanase